MVLRDLFRDVFQTLWAHKLRTALTMFGIAWGVISIVLMVAAGEGLRVGQEKVSQNFGRDLMIVFAGRTSLQAGGTRAGRQIEYLDSDISVVQADSPDCEWVLPELETSRARIHSNYNAGAQTVTGSYPPFQDIRSLTVAEGRFYDWGDLKETRRVAFLGTEVKKQLFGGRNAIGENIYLNDIPYKVIGVMKTKDQDSSYDGFDINKVYVPYTAMHEDFPNKPPWTLHGVDQLLVTPKSVAQHETCKGEVRAALGRLHNFDPHDKEAANIWDTVEEAQEFKTMTDGMKYFLGAVGLVTLFLGGLSVMNVMLVAVRERTREIGVRKAVGAQSHNIMMQFFVETMIVVFVSGGLGMAISFGFCSLINLLPMPQYFAGLLPTWQSGVLAVGLLGLVAVLAAMYPARQAASIDPIEALRYEAGG
jgi:putative ABC transport system permease protein